MATVVLSLVYPSIGASVPDSWIQSGGEGKPLGLVLAGEGEGQGKRIMAEPRTQAVPPAAADASEQALRDDILGSNSVVLRWKWNTQKDNSVPDLRWGRFYMPMASAGTVDLTGKAHLLLWLRPVDAKSGEISVQLQNAAGKDGPRVQIRAFSAGLTTLVAIPVETLTRGIDSGAIRTLVIEVGGDYPQNTDTGWYLERLAATEQRAFPGLGRIGAVDLGKHVAITWEPRGTVDRLRVTTHKGKTIDVDASAEQAVLDRGAVGSGFVVQPVGASRIGPSMKVVLPPAPVAGTVALQYDGPARTTAVSPYLMGVNAVTIPAEGAGTYRLAYLSEPTGKQIVRLPDAKAKRGHVRLIVPAYSAMVCVMDLQQ